MEIRQGHNRPDHVHLLLSVPSHFAPSRVMQAIKGRTSHHLLEDHRRLRSEFWGRYLWVRGYFVASTGTVTDETVAEYIRLQAVEAQDDDCYRVTETCACTARRWLALVDFSRTIGPRLQARVIDFARGADQPAPLASAHRLSTLKSQQ